MFYEEIRINQELPYISICSLSIIQQQINFSGNAFWNKCCRCNEGSLYNVKYMDEQRILCAVCADANHYENMPIQVY